MNSIALLGRLTKDVEVKFNAVSNTAIAKFTLAVDRKFKKEGQPTADFLNCVAFGKTGENISKFFKKGSKIALIGSVQTGSYDNKEGKKVYTFDINVNEFEFVEKTEKKEESNDGFESVDRDEVPF